MQDLNQKIYTYFGGDNLSIPWGKFEPPYLGKAAAAAARAALLYPAVLQVHAESFSCFRNPPTSNIDYMICNVPTYVFVLMRAYIYAHRGWAHPTLSLKAPSAIGTLISSFVTPHSESAQYALTGENV